MHVNTIFAVACHCCEGCSLTPCLSAAACRDIKPCNLLLFSDGYLKLADLGCCCLLPSGVDSARTRTGTAQYMAPEVVAPANTTGYSFPVDM
jgi:hypothetical protein